MKQIGKNLEVISYMQAFRRFKKLNLEIDNHRIDKDDLRNIQIAVYSTRVSIYNNKVGHSELNIRERKYNGYDQVRKLNTILNIMDRKVINLKYTNSVVADYLSACNILEGISNKYKVHSIKADGAYDIKRVHKEYGKYNIIPIIQLRKDTKIYLADYLSERNKYISRIRSYSYEDGMNEWKKKVK